ncbi:pyruvate dehydrogenase complex dihydrolipoamide acetyltransferase [Gemmatirosa kalamazoonensis]|uniref:Acetyltransferase component of pyruvate dehydrogenase complex n=1 Tax=Gemmatirosa kalamazoonensis TaxID=861299 RepID=W0RLB3_9BACT|nr:pyruvate dehydrogenase complex dihydrolipoamide acetyltransferase [Gemmatirosa kalamazoonensis]AHG90203.1 pyruvate dehydrogenase complex dihydrolipoamide acetyltransferase [Gemmatirosa kalamazoonensis]
MATKVMMEALSPTMEEGRLVKWLKNEGDAVKTGDTLAEVETDKAIMELVARGDGVLRKRLIDENTSTPVGQLIAVIAAPDENIDALVGGAAPAPAAAPAAAQPEAVVAQQREQAGASSVPRAPSQSQGEASTPPQEKVAAAPPGAAGGAAPRTPMPQAGGHESEQAPHAADNGGRVLSSPLARRMAAEAGLELEQVRGSGPGGRIIRRDVEAAAAAPRAPSAAPAAASEPAAAAPAAPAAAAPGDFQDVPLTQIRKTIARRLSESIGPVPTFYLTAEFDMARAAELRTQLAAMGDEYKVSFNDIVLKAVAVALSMHPEVNAHWLGDKIRQHRRVHLGMAVAIEDGLITPVIFDADKKRMGQISREAKELAGRARERKLKPEEYTGSTFSVSNLGMFGIDQFTAIINPPEAGILAIGAIEDKPVAVNGEVKVAKRMRVTMSCDHRVIDGALGAKFLQTVRKLVESPLSML